MNTRLLFAAAGGLLATACVDHRPIRNGLSTESVYLEKEDLTQPDTRYTATEDDNWLYRVTVVGASSPNVVGDYAFPGLEGDPKLVKFRFRDNALQIVSADRLQEDRAADPDDDLATTEGNVLLEFSGQHVDVKLRESLDGERTNYLEENTELPWQSRQKFRVDFSTSSLDPITNAAWFYGELLSWCASTVTTHYVPDSFSWEKTCAPDEVEAEYSARRAKYEAACEGLETGSDACKTARQAILDTPAKCSETGTEELGFEVEVTYQLTVTGGCYDMIMLATGTGTSTIRYRFSFHRPKTGESTTGADGTETFVPSYEAEEIGEKDIVNKKYGVFQVLNLFRDHDTGLFSAKALAKRWNPAREEPVVFYFHPGFPPEYKSMFADDIAKATNDILEKAGAKMRIAFREWDDGGVKRRHGDMRYSFANWHHDIDTTLGLLGYGPSTADPRTGEVFSATMNLYNVGLDIYRYRVQNFLEAKGGEAKPDPDKPWEEIECPAGATVAPGNPELCASKADDAKADCDANNASGERDCAAERQTALDACTGTPRLGSALFTEMRRTMNIPEESATGTKADFVPAQTHPDFAKNFQRILPELRYGEPGYNPYVYRPGDHQSRLPQLREKMEKVRVFQQRLEGIAANENPFEGLALYGREGIAAQLDFREQFREWQKLHTELKHDRDQLLANNNVHVFEDTDAIQAIGKSARRCIERDDGKHTWESDAEYSDRIIDAVVFKTGIHEFGHNIGLRHNFYGSADPIYTRPEEISASVMDYVAPWAEANTPRTWGRYDELALSWIYGDEKAREAAMKENPLYCTDEHRLRSPLCRAFDLGITPAQIVLNDIEQYDWLYELRNKRAYRKFWDTTGYVGGVYASVYDIQRMWHLALFDWGGGGVQEVLKRLDQVEDPSNVKTDQEYDEMSLDFYNDISAAIGMTMAFYDSILNEPASERNYQTEYDPFYGDVIRLGIIIDKLFATFAFMDLQDISYYDPNVATYSSMYDAAFGTQNDALAQRVLDDMLGANYDTFPWFKYYALNIFAAVTNTNLIGNIQYRDRIAIQRYNRAEDLEAEYGEGTVAEATRADNSTQSFLRNGEEYIYSYLPDRSWHLVASKSKAPVAYQFVKEYNEALRSDASADTDNYGLKILLAYYEYFNNFVGF
ncbi:zinc-dependent metalloprotease [Myxococcota bacterium]|nr:zinc-dependent metalloprotease [Myxococcota bacterium]